MNHDGTIGLLLLFILITSKVKIQMNYATFFVALMPGPKILGIRGQNVTCMYMWQTSHNHNQIYLRILAHLTSKV